MRIFITGATGLIGRRLVVDRLERGDHVLVLSRDAAKAARLFAAHVNPNVEVVVGDATEPGAWQQRISECDAVIHLAGAGVGDRRWSRAYKRQIVTSRINSTHQIVHAIRNAAHRPRVLISASAIGYYGECGDERITEDHGPGRGFLEDLSVAWEGEARAAEALGVRVVTPRLGVVLDERGGALREMIKPFRMLVGGPIGVRRAWLSWVHWRDVVGIIDLALRRDALRGPVNVTSPSPATNWTFAQALGKVLRRPWWFAAPKPVLRIALGEFARYVGVSQRIIPKAALQHGYRFAHPDLPGALRSLLREHMRDVEEDAHAPDSTTTTTPMGDAPSASSDAQPAQRIRLVAVDVDGTLLGRNGQLAPGVVQACRKAEQAGCAIVLASTRGPRGLEPVIDALRITTPAIAYHGALIWDAAHRTAQFHQSVDPETARELLRIAREAEPAIHVALETPEGWLTDRIDHAFEEDIGGITEPDATGPLESFLDRPISRISLFGPADHVSSVRSAISEGLWKQQRIAVFQPSPHLLHIVHPRVDKAIALQRIAQRFEIAREEVLAIGDGPDDAGMIEWAGFGVALDHADQRVRSLADATISGADGLGVARALQRYVLSA